MESAIYIHSHCWFISPFVTKLFAWSNAYSQQQYLGQSHCKWHNGQSYDSTYNAGDDVCTDNWNSASCIIVDLLQRFKCFIVSCNIMVCISWRVGKISSNRESSVFWDLKRNPYKTVLRINAVHQLWICQLMHSWVLSRWCRVIGRPLIQNTTRKITIKIHTFIISEQKMLCESVDKSLCYQHLLCSQMSHQSSQSSLEVPPRHLSQF